MSPVRPLLVLLAAAALSGCPQPLMPTPLPTVSPSASPSASPSVSPSIRPSTAPASAHNSDVSEQEGCQYLKQGPSAALTASAEDATAPAILSDNRRYDVTLPQNGLARGGVLKFEVAAAAEWSFYTDRDVFFVVRDAAGMTLAGARIPGSKFCPEIYSHRAYELKQGTYYIELESSSETMVKLVVKETHPGGAGAGAH